MFDIFRRGFSSDGPTNQNGYSAPPKRPPQDYEAIKQQCLSTGHLFEDPIFSPRASKRSDCIWLRPFEMTSSPKFISSGISRFDVVQGELGDCWLVAAAANLTLNHRLFELVVPHDQSFDRGSYCGIFKFRFWQFGKWVEIVIDDRLPTRDGKLLFMKSSDPDEFWSPLLEKAYAKLHGSYDALRGGTTCEAMVDLTGGVTEFYDIQTNEAPPHLFSIIKRAFERGSLIGCSIEALDDSQLENELPNGLVKGHAYSVTSAIEIDIRGRRLPMLRLRNPWSGTNEWNGPWSDKSNEWSMISDYDKQKIGLCFDADGEFWISFHDFRSNFTRVELCNLTPDDHDSNIQRHWYAQMFEGSWIRGCTAGGCRNNLNTFAMNPQYFVTLSKPDEEDEEGNCTMIVALMQKNRRSAKKYQMGSSELTIGFAIYSLKDGIIQHDSIRPLGTQNGQQQQLLSTDFFKYNCSAARSPTYINLREVTARFNLPVGTYAIIPSTFDKGEEGEFILRVWTEAAAKASAGSTTPDIRPPSIPVAPTPSPRPSPSPTPAPMPAPRPRPLDPPKPSYPAYPMPPNEPDKKPPVYPAYPQPSPTPNAPAYPPYPQAPGYPTLPGFGPGGDIPYPTLPEEPSIIRRKVKPPPPGPSIDISIGEVISTVSTIISILTACYSAYQRMMATSQTYPYDQQRGYQGSFAQAPRANPAAGYNLRTSHL